MSNELLPYGMHTLRPKDGPDHPADYRMYDVRRRDTQIQPVAQEQLNKWRIYARRWQIHPEMLVTESGHMLGEGVEQLHFICAGSRYYSTDRTPWGPCGQSIAVLYDGGNFLYYDTETLESLIVAHIRNVHREIEDVVYNGS